jgi:hypothetical protein
MATIVKNNARSSSSSSSVAPKKGKLTLARGASGKETVHSRKALSDIAAKNVANAKTAKNAKTSPAKAKTSPAKNNAPVIRQSKFAGKTIIANRKDNPRREGTWGYKSFGIILKAKGKISYEAYKSAGGRNNDLQWDLDRNFVSVK